MKKKKILTEHLKKQFVPIEDNYCKMKFKRETKKQNHLCNLRPLMWVSR